MGLGMQGKGVRVCGTGIKGIGRGDMGKRNGCVERVLRAWGGGLLGVTIQYMGRVRLTLTKAHGSWRTAHDIRLTAHGSR